MYSKIGPFELVIGGSMLIFMISLFFIIMYFYYSRKMMISKLNHQKDLLKNEIIIIENERKRIARDLHDEVGASLAYIGLNLNQINNYKIENKDFNEKLILCYNQLNKTIQDVRRISHGLLPPVLEMFGLTPALEEYINGLNSKININFNPVDDFNIMDPNISLQLYRVILEIINNSIKHSGGQNINIKMEKHLHQNIITIEDDGIGFNFEKMKQTKGLGLKNIISRLEAIDAEFKFDIIASKGSRIRITLSEVK